ncbi:uncharacterized protein LOC108158701 isoform X2 [Drosophila miranda]|uniref:uncharacterized protein LOC108158701 isoform X2 n=1 Tax=Drosophila miranda TaxID=7229 RepID=UPI0007E65B7F|nr:uncharacterized protein LOC108158701 isoform X2 [Drosophila miranda]
MIYLQNCCCFVDLRLGAIISGLVHAIADVLGGFFIMIMAGTGTPDLCHKLTIFLFIVHLISCAGMVYGSIKLSTKFMIPYILMTLAMILYLIPLFVADVILAVWYFVLITYILLFLISLYCWLVAYSFYAALGGTLFI